MKMFNLFSKKQPKGFLSSAEAGVFHLEFYHDEQDPTVNRVEIRTESGFMTVTLGPTHDGYGFLMSCLEDKATDAMEAYCGMLSASSVLLATDVKFPKTVQDAWAGFFKEIMDRGAEAAAAVTDEQNEADEALMSEAVRISELSQEEQEKLTDEIIEKLQKAESIENNAEEWLAKRPKRKKRAKAEPKKAEPKQAKSEKTKSEKDE